ncbi:hypothetical protein [Seinonella peptonophila]|uniref:hypothetical protein n=1 Tax=Seinonella peptonophila TaxID=112248 RepID=UPI00111492A9|nr:hypothetical protein [Seinonella peptonophila]
MSLIYFFLAYTVFSVLWGALLGQLIGRKAVGRSFSMKLLGRNSQKASITTCTIFFIIFSETINLGCTYSLYRITKMPEVNIIEGIAYIIIGCFIGAYVGIAIGLSVLYLIKVVMRRR